MRRALIVTAVLLATMAAHAQPSHCERPLEGGPWPEVAGERTPSPHEARRIVDRFRAQWRRLPRRGVVLRSFSECMAGSYEHFVVRRVSADDARRAIASPNIAAVIAGDAIGLGSSEVWEVYWGGASRRVRPSGAVSGFLSIDRTRLVVTVHWLEG